MKSIRDWNGLSKYGIIPLTGEADRTGRRMLCDITPNGREIVMDLFGISMPVLAASYNGGGAIGSMMLPYSLFNDLAAWCLLVAEKCDEVFYVVSQNESCTYQREAGVRGRDAQETKEEWDEHVEFLISIGFEIRRIRIRTEHPGEGTRAQHQMSGRIA